jgi:tRNA-2-methylthio-N6-dimethylallyladenosine synthase
MDESGDRNEAGWDEGTTALEIKNYKYGAEIIGEGAQSEIAMKETTHQSKRIYLRTFGCQMNRYDSERLLELMRERRFEPVADERLADLIFINTCSVRDKAEQKAFSYLGRLRALKRRRPRLVIALGGCVAQQHGESLLQRLPHLDLVVGTHGIGRLPELLERQQTTGKPQCFTGFNYDFDKLDDGHRRPVHRAVSAYVTIMRGCDNFCTYCVVPWVRGRECSRPADEIVREVESLVESGAREVILLGQNVNSYGKGLRDQIDFPGLLRRVAQVDGLRRIRFTTSHPKDLSPSLMRCFGDLEPLCPHIHLPVQCGSDGILESMNRGYSCGHYIRLVEELRSIRADVAISSDVIVGFPGETEEDFQETLDLLDRVRFQTVFSFRYSDRPLTVARGLKGKVSEEVKLRRLQTLQRLQEQITLEGNEARVGQVVPVLVEGLSQAGKVQFTGRTPHNQVANFTGWPELVGEEVPVLISAAYAHSLLGVVSVESSHILQAARETLC